MHETVPVVSYSNFWWQFEVSTDLCAQENSKENDDDQDPQPSRFFFFDVMRKREKCNTMQKCECDAKMRKNSHHIAFFSFKNPKKSSIDRSFAFASHYQPCLLERCQRQKKCLLSYSPPRFMHDMY
jgi:hypothetical protein